MAQSFLLSFFALWQLWLLNAWGLRDTSFRISQTLHDLFGSEEIHYGDWDDDDGRDDVLCNDDDGRDDVLHRKVVQSANGQTHCEERSCKR